MAESSFGCSKRGRRAFSMKGKDPYKNNSYLRKASENVSETMFFEKFGKNVEKDKQVNPLSDTVSKTQSDKDACEGAGSSKGENDFFIGEIRGGKVIDELNKYMDMSDEKKRIQSESEFSNECKSLEER